MMTVQDLIALRNTLGINQTEMAEEIGLSLRAYQAIEGGESQLRKLHILAAERAALSRAVEVGNPMLAPANVRKESLKLASIITDG